ncbi:hypothetical protein, partial [Bradyrhizobium sp. 174]|uniref:hypothetical protein n=1 Tax=Bradyrhizobium sp. 174 TaxID=2782645 RepID=UPI001FF99E5F
MSEAKPVNSHRSKDVFDDGWRKSWRDGQSSTRVPPLQGERQAADVSGREMTAGEIWSHTAAIGAGEIAIDCNVNRCSDKLCLMEVRHALARSSAENRPTLVGRRNRGVGRREAHLAHANKCHGSRSELFVTISLVVKEDIEHVHAALPRGRFAGAT